MELRLGRRSWLDLIWRWWWMLLRWWKDLKGFKRWGYWAGNSRSCIGSCALRGRKPTPSQHHSSNDRINVTSVTPNTTDSSQGTRSPTPLLKRGDLRHRLTRKLFDTPNADLTREVQELKGVVTTLQKKLEAVAPTISTNQTHLDPSDLRLRLTSRSGYGRSHKSETDPSYQSRHVARSESYLRREKSIEDSTNSPPAVSDKIRGRRCAEQKHCPQGRVHGPGRKVRPQGRTSRKPTSGPCPEEFTPPRDDSGYPLSKGIEKAKLPPNFRMPQCDLYDGSGDPGEHVYQFQTNMLLLQVSDAVMCRAFPTTLRKAAHAWFKSLRPRSIHSFAQLSDLFQKHFVSSRTRRKNSASLLNVVQERNESLSRYLGRFNAATLEIDNLDESVKYTAFMRGLRPTTKFAFAVNKSPPGNMSDLLDKANKYIQAEEYLETHKEHRGDNGQGQEKRAREDSPRSGRGSKRSRRDERRPKEMFDMKNLTPLNARPSQILHEIKDKEILERPEKMRSAPSQRDRNLWCHYHNDHGHTTDKCESLKRAIEALIKRGHLRGYVNRRNEKRETTPLAGRDEVRENAGVINTISGGIAAGGSSGQGRKAYVREVLTTMGPPTKKQKKEPAQTISFSDDDVGDTRIPHDDPLVVTLRVGNFDVKRILVDNGSSAEVLFYEAFQRMNIPSDRLRKIDTPLYGFSNHPVVCEGIIALPVTVGAPPNQAKLMLDFVVVRVPSAYNAILGRTALNQLRAVVSTYHMKMKFPTENGVGEVKGDQAVARQCYMASCRNRANETLMIEDLRDETKVERGKPAEDLFDIELYPGNQEKTVRVGTGLSDDLKLKLVDLLRNYSDIFAWTASDMPGIDPKAIRKAKDFEWTEECQKSFEELKRYLSSPPLLTKPITGEDLFIYLSISEVAVSTVLIREEEGKQRPVYYISKVLQDVETRYPRIDKVALALVTSARKLRPYFQSHTIVVLTDQPLGKVLQNPDASGRLVNWSVELGEFDIKYQPRTAIKAQALSDFVVECTIPEDPQQLILSEVSDPWLLYVDDGVLYKKSFSLPYLKCLTPKEADYALQEVHEGICGQHLGGRNLAHKILRQGYFWPGMQRDAIKFTKRCDQCQKFAPLTHTPAAPLSILTSPIPFAMWGMDILGPFPMATGQRRFVIVAIDYFTKWTEAEPLATITASKCEEFFWKNVVCRFGVPKILITDNGKQFDNSNFRSFCEGLSICLRFTSVAHPQSNGQTENMNRSILQGLKRKLDDAKGAWVDELPKVLWAYRTTPHSVTGETPFLLCFGTEALLPVEVGLPTVRVLQFSETENEENLRGNLDLLDDVRAQALDRVISTKQRVARFYNRRVRMRIFRVGDLVLRKLGVSNPKAAVGKLSPNWEGPYKISKVLRPGTYSLETLSGEAIPRTWNADNLRRYYQ
ncbi:hypothetical protein RJ639_037761 [Escallonia herrerae]|uniref:Integrase catalytic domain-containing protein n=1 Tax=Escallonia herrerae TaxID=1293975 RepID=A0AA89B6Z8_9ASTE|nr:hypothetical protein RJ639_037761 [Escallonia herrerae]